MTQGAAVAYLREIMRDRVESEGLRTFAAGRSLPLGQVRGLLGGQSVLSTTIEAACEALDLELYIGPPRDAGAAAPEDEAPEQPEQHPDAPPTWAADLRAGLREDLAQLLRGPGAAGEAYEGPQPDPLQMNEDDPGAEADLDLVRRYGLVRLAAGAGATEDREDLTSPVAFQRQWLRQHGLRSETLFLVEVAGDSMVPTLGDQDSVLVDESKTRPRSGRIYALRTRSDGLLIKRLRKRRGHWWADSDAPGHEPRALDEDDEVLGLVVWWAHTVTQ